MDDYPTYGLLVGFSLWGTLWRLLFPLGFWHTFACRVGPTRGGTATQPYTKEEEEKMAAMERKEKKEAKKKALKEEQAAKLKKMEEEMAREKERLKKEEEEKLKEVDEEEEGPPLQKSGQHSGSSSDEMEKKISEWVANLSLGEEEEVAMPNSNTGGDLEKKISEWVANLTVGEEEEVAMYIPKDEQEAAMKKWEAEDVLTRRAMEDEQRMAWKLAVMREKKRRVEAANAAMQELAEVRTALTTQLTPQVDLQRKVEIIAQSVDRLAKVQEKHYEFSRSQEISVRSMPTGLRDFARELVGAVGSEVSHRLEKTERFCVGAIEGVKVAAPKEEEARPRREPVKVKFPDSYSGKREKNFDNWEANVKTYVHLQQVSPDQQVLIAIHALRDEAASFSRSLVRAANCSDDPVLYSSFTSLTEFLKLLRERFADVTRSVKASDKLQTIHSRKWKSARALKGTIDELVAVPDHGVTEGQLVNLFYRAMPEAFRGQFFAKSEDPATTYDSLSREVVAFEAKSVSVSTFWHKDLDKESYGKATLSQGRVSLDTSLTGVAEELKERMPAWAKMKKENKGQLILLDTKIFRSRVGALVDSGATRSYISRKALQKLRLGLKVQKLTDPIVSILADSRTMIVEDYVEGVQAYFRLEKDGKVEKVLHSLTLLVEDSLPFDIVLGMDWGEAAGATLHLKENEYRLPSSSGEAKTALLFHVLGVENSLAHCCLSAPAFASLVKKEGLEEQVFVAYVRPVTERTEEKPMDPAIAKLLKEFKDLTELRTGTVPRPIQHRIEIEPGSRTPKGEVYRMSPWELEELRKQLDELLEKGWIRPTNYYRKFVRNFSTIAAPLRKLLRKETIWKWDKDCTSAMKKLKQALIEYPVLKVAERSLPFVVTTDASQYGIGAVLQQDDGNGYRPVEFMSARMPSEKVATSTYERELYALRQALDHWKHYLLGRHFKVYSDHQTLRWLKTQAKMTPKLTRWAAEIDQYDFELKLVKGKYNVVADALSRRADNFGAIVHYLDIGKDLQQRVREA
ncbi:hypothetical protein CBR_g54891 [Chara braunii]|uniref:RNA-directed DNA polymerase n=1 Tax=Chara braunii TaxID=69332 RepID=A0A388JPS7_CHABU|nr:hypothetical protein CBR_g54891 [Chara braunii]|eukprot:GBG59787.1 hypothetical protein CBR_g54891 [Chara braunii]